MFEVVGYFYGVDSWFVFWMVLSGVLKCELGLFFYGVVMLVVIVRWVGWVNVILDGFECFG